MSDVSPEQHVHMATKSVATKLLGHSELPVVELFRFINNNVKSYLTGNIQIADCAVDVPRYGALSNTLTGMPIVLYDEPTMARQWPTAFTQGTHIFVNAYFAYEMLRKDAASQMRETRMRFVLLHEAVHVAFSHTEGRMHNVATPRVRNYVFDAVANPRILSAYTDIRIGDLANHIVAAKPAAIEAFKEMSEERAMSLFLKDPEQFEKMAGHPKPGPESPKDQHFQSTREFAEWMEKNNMSDAMKELGIPPSTDVEGHKALAEHVANHINGAAEKTRRNINAARAAGARVPGAALDEAFLQTVDLVNKPRLDWLVRLRQAVKELGGSKFALTDDVPDDNRYTPTAGTGFASQPWLPGRGPVAKTSKKVLFLVDTSGSMGDADLSEAYSEIFRFAKTSRAKVPELIIHCADTSLRGKPLRLVPGVQDLIREQNQKQVQIAGRGGTDLENCLKELGALYKRDFMMGNVAAVIYCSDLGDKPPNRAAIPGPLPRVTMLCPSSQYNEAFAAAITGWADVVAIEDHQIVRIDDTKPSATVTTPSNAPPPAPSMSM